MALAGNPESDDRSLVSIPKRVSEVLWLSSLSIGA